MDFSRARELVVDDQRESYPNMSATEAIAHVRNTVMLTDLDESSDPELVEAYRTVLREGRTSGGKLRTYPVIVGDRSMIRLSATTNGDDNVEFDLTLDDAYDHAMQVLNDVWSGAKNDLGKKAEVFRMLGLIR